MFHQLSTMLAVLLVVLAGVTVLIMLEMNSRSREAQKKSGWIMVHRTLGYLFLILFASMLVYMVVRAGSLQDGIPDKAALHIVLALLLIPLIMIKIVIARRQAELSTKLILLGLAIFGLSFGLTGITAGYYALHRSSFSYESAAGEDNISLSAEPGKNIMNRKCSKCHSLERVYTSIKSNSAWTETVSKMADFDYPNITSSDVQQIVNYLVGRRKNADADIGRNLVSVKCSKCHSLDRVFGANMSEEEWQRTVSRMAAILGDAAFLSEQERNDIVIFLSSRQRPGKESSPAVAAQQDDAESQAARALIVRKCSAGCHALDRVLRPEKTKEEWTATINSMIELTGKPDYLSEQEKAEIIKFLSNRKKKEKEAGPSPVAPKSPTAAEDPLLSRKCTICHNLNRIHQAEKSKEEWQKTVKTMAETMNDPNFLSEKEKEEIVRIISSWEKSKK